MSQSVDRRVRIAAELLRKQESLPPPPCNLQASHKYQEEDLKESLTTDELARRVKLSPAHFRALFRRNLNTTPKRFAKQLKMENAIKLAENSSLTISQIIEVVGGGDESHFQRQFKKAFGKTLGEFRRLHAQQIEEELLEEKQER